MARTELLTTAAALERIGWRARSSLHRAEKAGRIGRAQTVRGRPLWRAEDVQQLIDAKGVTSPALTVDDVDQEFVDEVLASLRTELAELLAAGELEGTPTLRLMAAVLRRELALRTARGDAVDVDDLLRLDRLDLRMHHSETFEQLRELTRRRRS